MNYYQEITIIKTPDISPYFIWSKLYTQVHLALVEVKNPDETVDIGVSFPEYQCFEKGEKTITILGSKLRVFAKTEAELQQLDLSKWCERLLDYVHIKSIRAVGNQAKGNVVVKRFRQVKNNDRLTYSFAKKYGKSFEEVKAARIEHLSKKFGLSLERAESYYNEPKLVERPYIKIGSLNNKHQFSLEIEQSMCKKAVSGSFNTYGLSNQTTVPHW